MMHFWLLNRNREPYFGRIKSYSLLAVIVFYLRWLLRGLEVLAWSSALNCNGFGTKLWKYYLLYGQTHRGKRGQDRPRDRGTFALRASIVMVSCAVGAEWKCLFIQNLKGH